MSKNDDCIIYEGIKYYSVRQFSRLVNKSEQTIYGYIHKGNAIRKLKSKILFGYRVFIPASELTEYPFTPIGRGAEDRKYFYDEDARVIEEPA